MPHSTPLLAPHQQDDLLRLGYDAYRFELNNALRAATELAAHTNNEILTDDDLRKKVGYLRIVLESLRDVANDQIAPELGLVVGFSSLDGD